MIHAGLRANFVSDTAWTYWLVFRPNSLTTRHVNIYDAEALLGVSTDGTWGCAISSDLGIQPFAGTGGAEFVPNLAATDGVWTLLEVRQEAGTMYGRINDDAEESVAVGSLFATSGNLILGCAYNGTGSSEVDYAEFAISSVAEDPTVRADMREYLMYQYGIS
jgi:hypothetical protein